MKAALLKSASLVIDASALLKYKEDPTDITARPFTRAFCLLNSPIERINSRSPEKEGLSDSITA